MNIIINGYEFEPAGDGKTYVSKDIIFDSAFNEDYKKENANVYQGSDVQKALDEWFEQNAPEEIREHYDIDLLTATEIFGSQIQDDMDDVWDEQFWPAEPYKRLPIFKNYLSRMKFKKGAVDSFWWVTKSPYVDDKHFVCIVNQNGKSTEFNVSICYGIVPCLRLKSDATPVEELCDCFVDICEEDDSHSVSTEKPVRRHGHEIYAATWNNMGLTYVAKLNDKGEWELL